jgi:hypothetical protein
LLALRSFVGVEVFPAANRQTALTAAVFACSSKHNIIYYMDTNRMSIQIKSKHIHIFVETGFSG